jgi:hypothetical protein
MKITTEEKPRSWLASGLTFFILHFLFGHFHFSFTAA